VLAAELNECRAGVVFSEYRDDLRLGEARLAHMSFLFGLSATETHGINWPGLSGRRQHVGLYRFVAHTFSIDDQHSTRAAFADLKCREQER
jgi:hypothetical protein